MNNLGKIIQHLSRCKYNIIYQWNCMWFSLNEVPEIPNWSDFVDYYKVVEINDWIFIIGWTLILWYLVYCVWIHLCLLHTIQLWITSLRKTSHSNHSLHTFPKKMKARERKERYHHAFLPTRLPLEIVGRLLTAASTSTWAAALSSAPTHEYTHAHTFRRTQIVHPGRLALPLFSQMLS